MRYDVYAEVVEFENGKATYSVEYLMSDVRYTADGVVDTVSEAYARIREHRHEFRKELTEKSKPDAEAQRDRIQTAA